MVIGDVNVVNGLIKCKICNQGYNPKYITEDGICDFCDQDHLDDRPRIGEFMEGKSDAAIIEIIGFSIERKCWYVRTSDNKKYDVMYWPGSDKLHIIEEL